MKRETRYDYAAAVAMRYQRSSRQQKGWILDEFCAATGYHRKYAIKLLRGPFPRAALREVAEPVVEDGRVGLQGPWRRRTGAACRHGHHLHMLPCSPYAPFNKLAVARL